MVNIYILSLEHGKYYVGKTDNVDTRLKQHYDGGGSSWTTKYKPINVIEVIENCDEYDENKYVFKYMHKYGIDNVRGGSFVTIEFEDFEIYMLEKILNGSSDKCFRCGRNGHFINNCFAKRHVDGYELSVSEDEEEVYECKKCKKDYTFDDLIEIHDRGCKASVVICDRCGRNGHVHTKCYAKTHMNGKFINK